MIDRPVILGMNLNGRPGEPLSPDGGAGRRLFEMSGMTVEEYEATFERRNLMPGLRWHPHRARSYGAQMRHQLRGRRVIVLGREVWRALQLPNVAWFERHGDYALVPHPSGCNLMYNNVWARYALRRTLEDHR